MKVLKREILRGKKWKFTFTCTGCRSTLEAEEGDVKCGYLASYCWPEDNDKQYYVVCSVCRHIKTICELKSDFGAGDKIRHFC
jgi:hypothetical protein